MYLRNKTNFVFSVSFKEETSTLKTDKRIIVEIFLNCKFKTNYLRYKPLGLYFLKIKSKTYEDKTSQTADKMSIFCNGTAVKMI